MSRIVQILKNEGRATPLPLHWKMEISILDFKISQRWSELLFFWRRVV
jgi:hypothetical protein